MFECAAAGDWEPLAKLEQTRLPVFNLVFAQGISGKEELARQVLLLDAETLKLAEAGMPALQHQLLMIRNSGKAKNAYQAVQESTSGND